MSNKNQSSVEQLIEMIDWEISMLKMDAGNHVEWSMAVMLGILKKIKKKAEQTKTMHKEEIIKFAEDWEKSNLDCKEDLYTDTFNNE